MADQLPIGRDAASVRRRIEAMEHAARARLHHSRHAAALRPRCRSLDLIPVVGGVVAAAMGAWLVWEARNLGMSKLHLARMAGNIGFDSLLGADPLGRRRSRFLLPLEHAAISGSSSAGSTSTIPRRGDRGRGRGAAGASTGFI